MENEVDEISLEEATKAEEASFNAEDSELPTETPVEHDVEVEEVKEVVQEPEYARITKAELADLMAKAGSVDKAFGKIGGIERDLAQLRQPGQPIELTADSFPLLKEQFPELAELQAKDMRELFSKIKGGGSIDTEAVEKLVSEKVSGIRQQAIDANLDAIVGGDWVAEFNSAECQTWKDSQPEDVKALTNSDSLRDAAKFLRMYQSFKNKPAERTSAPKPSVRSQQLAASVSPKGSGGIQSAEPNTEEDAFNAEATRLSDRKKS